MVTVPRFNTLNIGNVVSSAEAIKGQRLRNALSHQGLREQEEVTKRRARVREIRQMYEGAPEAIKQLRADGLFEEAEAMRAESVKVLSQTRDLVLGYKDLITNQEEYDRLRSSLIQEGAIYPDDMPVEYSDSWFAKEAKRIGGKLTTLEQIVGVDAEGAPVRQQLTQDGQGNVLATSPEFVSPGDRSALRQQQGRAGAGGAVLKAADSNAIRSGVVNAFDGQTDLATGNYTFKDDGDRRLAQSAIERAEEIMLSQPGMTIGRAVTQALRETVPDLELEQVSNTLATDPLRLRQ